MIFVEKLITDRFHEKALSVRRNDFVTHSESQNTINDLWFEQNVLKPTWATLRSLLPIRSLIEK